MTAMISRSSRNFNFIIFEIRGNCFRLLFQIIIGDGFISFWIRYTHFSHGMNLGIRRADIEFMFKHRRIRWHDGSRRH